MFGDWGTRLVFHSMGLSTEVNLGYGVFINIDKLQQFDQLLSDMGVTELDPDGIEPSVDQLVRKTYKLDPNIEFIIELNEGYPKYDHIFVGIILKNVCDILIGHATMIFEDIDLIDLQRQASIYHQLVMDNVFKLIGINQLKPSIKILLDIE